MLLSLFRWCLFFGCMIMLVGSYMWFTLWFKLFVEILIVSIMIIVCANVKSTIYGGNFHHVIAHSMAYINEGCDGDAKESIGLGIGASKEEKGAIVQGACSITYSARSSTYWHNVIVVFFDASGYGTRHLLLGWFFCWFGRLHKELKISIRGSVEPLSECKQVIEMLNSRETCSCIHGQSLLLEVVSASVYSSVWLMWSEKRGWVGHSKDSIVHNDIWVCALSKLFQFEETLTSQIELSGLMKFLLRLMFLELIFLNFQLSDIQILWNKKKGDSIIVTFFPNDFWKWKWCWAPMYTWPLLTWNQDWLKIG